MYSLNSKKSRQFMHPRVHVPETRPFSVFAIDFTIPEVGELNIVHSAPKRSQSGDMGDTAVVEA